MTIILSSVFTACCIWAVTKIRKEYKELKETLDNTKNL